jgi:hypothetical protein
MHELVLRIKKPELCYVFAENATKRGHDDLALQAFRRAVDLRAEEHEGVTDDEALSWGQRKRKRATGTWQMVSRQGILPTLRKRIDSKRADEALDKLKALKLEDYSFGAVASTIGLDLDEAA